MTCDIVGFSDEGFQDGELRAFLSVFCRGCRKPIGAAITIGGQHMPAIHELRLVETRHAHPVNLTDAISVHKTWPSIPEPYASESLPKKVRKSLLDAEHTLINGIPRVARGEFRIVLDVATKEILADNADAVTGKKPNSLYERIKFLAENSLLTPSLAEWADGIRSITNPDLHDCEDVLPREAEEIANFTRLFLIYVFELPAEVAEAKAEADRKKAEARDD